MVSRLASTPGDDISDRPVKEPMDHNGAEIVKEPQRLKIHYCVPCEGAGGFICQLSEQER